MLTLQSLEGYNVPSNIRLIDQSNGTYSIRIHSKNKLDYAVLE